MWKLYSSACCAEKLTFMFLISPGEESKRVYTCWFLSINRSIQQFKFNLLNLPSTLPIRFRPSKWDPIGTAPFFQVVTVVELQMLGAPEIVGATLSVLCCNSNQLVHWTDVVLGCSASCILSACLYLQRTLSRHMPMHDLALQTDFRAKFFSVSACCFCGKLPLLCLYHEGLDTDGASSCLLPFHMRSVSSWREDFLRSTIRETDNHSLLCFAPWQLSYLTGLVCHWPSCG